MYSLRRNHTNMETPAPVKLPLNRKREYLSRCVKSQILKRKGRKKRWLQGLPRLDPVQTVKEIKVKGRGRKRGRKPLPKLELSYPDNEIYLTEEESGFEEKTDTEDNEPNMPHLENELNKSEQKEVQLEQMNDLDKKNGEHTDIVCGSGLSEQTQEDSQTQLVSKLCEGPSSERQAAVEANLELDGPPLELIDCPVELLHNYSLKSKKLDCEKPSESTASEELNGNTEQESQPAVEAKVSSTEVKAKKTWKDRVLRTQQYAHLMYHCNVCHKDYKGLNVMRHALSHLKSRKLRCILCGKRFKQLPFAKKHVLDHIDTMCKQKPPDKESCTEDTPAANGIIDNVENQCQPQGENQSTISENETLEQKPGSKMKVSSLKREERIIRNLRTLIKKTSVLHKKCKNPDMNIFKQVDFKDEQVVIRDGLVIVRDPSVMEKEGEEAGKEMSAGENGYGLDITYHLCPSESCDRVFLRISTTLTKHAIKCHINEEKVLEKTYVWAKHKCSLCLRQTQFLQHYKDHMKLHNTPLPHFCYHLECNQRFLTQQELKDHVSTHQPFRPQCPFTDCEKLFSSLQGLYDHEWRHYIPAPQKEELELGPNRQIKQSAEAPWKQRVKVEEIWLQNKKGQRESPTPDNEASNVQDLREKSKAEDQACEVPDSDQNLSKSDNCSEKTASNEHDDSKPTVNGYEDVTRNPSEESMSASSTAAATATAPSKRCRKRPTIEWDPINVRDVEDMSTMAEGVQQNMGEPHITEHKTFKPEDPSYATFVKAPFIRPPPSTYLDESLLSMRKRRAIDEVAPRKYVYWNHKKKKEPAQENEQQVVDVAPEQKVRHRCEKCLSSFSSLEELQTHQALNTCSSLFGFDSDDES